MPQRSFVRLLLPLRPSPLHRTAAAAALPSSALPGRLASRLALLPHSDQIDPRLVQTKASPHQTVCAQARHCQTFCAFRTVLPRRCFLHRPFQTALPRTSCHRQPQLKTALALQACAAEQSRQTIFCRRPFSTPRVFFHPREKLVSPVATNLQTSLERATCCLLYTSRCV